MSRVDHWASIRDRSTFKTLFAVPKPGPEPIAPEPEPRPDLEVIRRELAEAKKTVAELTDELATIYGAAFAGRNIAKAIAKIHRVSFTDLVSQRRHQNIVHARQHAMWEIRQRTKLSLPQIGKILGDRDHSTILHGIRAHAKRMAKLDGVA
jgi:chromosomal replication initiation ATPase DnaA